MDIFPWQGKILYLKYLLLLLDIKAVSGVVVTYLSSFYSRIIFLEKIPRRRIAWFSYEDF